MKPNDQAVNEWMEKLFLLHRSLLCRDELSYQERETLGNLVEAMTNIDTPEKLEAFVELCYCYPTHDVVLVPKKAP